MNSKLSINCLNFSLREEIRAEVIAATEKLFHLELYVAQARLTIESDYNVKSKIIYKTSLLLELRSSVIIVCDEAELPIPAVKSVVDQAERQLLERLYLRQPDPTGAPRSPAVDHRALAS